MMATVVVALSVAISNRGLAWHPRLFYIYNVCWCHCQWFWWWKQPVPAFLERPTLAWQYLFSSAFCFSVQRFIRFDLWSWSWSWCSAKSFQFMTGVSQFCWLLICFLANEVIICAKLQSRIFDSNCLGCDNRSSSYQWSSFLVFGNPPPSPPVASSNWD